MACTKTGCHVYLPEYQEWAYGDAFEYNGVAYFRFVSRERTPICKVKHYTITIESEFDKPTDGNCQTVIASTFVNHGYEGVPL